MSMRQRIFTSDVAALVVFAGCIALMVATLVGWDPTFGALDRTWRHPLFVAILVSAAVAGWFTCRAKYRDTARREGLRDHASKGLRLGVVAFLVSLGWALVVGSYIK